MRFDRSYSVGRHLVLRAQLQHSVTDAIDFTDAMSPLAGLASDYCIAWPLGEKNGRTVGARRTHTDAEVRSCSRRRLALAGRQSQSPATWVVVQLVGRNKAQSLFTATEARVRKRSSNLIRI